MSQTSQDDDNLFEMESRSENSPNQYEPRPRQEENFSSINWLESYEVGPAGGGESEHPMIMSTSGVGARSMRSRPVLTALLIYAVDGLQPWIAAGLVGGLIGIIASAIEVVTHWITDLKLGVCVDYFWVSENICCMGQHADGCTSFSLWDGVLGVSHSMAGDFVFYVAFATMFAVLASWLCIEYEPFAAGSGIVEIKTILSGIRVRGYLAARVLFLKCVGLCLSVGSGLSIGKEGPFVHVGCCVAELVRHWIPMYRKNEAAQLELISCAAGAGIAVAFGSPIGGVLFALEEVCYYFHHRWLLQTFFCTTVSVLVLSKIDPTHTGRLVQFAVEYRHPWHWFELGGFALLGILGGVAGAVINMLNAQWCRLRRRSKMADHPLLEVMFLSLLTASVNYVVPFLRRGMLETLGELFADCEANASSALCSTNELDVLIAVLVAGIVRLLFLVATFGTKVPGGCFVPPLFIGACIGRAVGLWMKGIRLAHKDAALFASCTGLETCVIPGVYAIVGAAAVLAGVTRMTLCLVVIMFELTGGLDYVVPCMLATILSKWIADFIGSPSIYEVHIELNKLPYLDPKLQFDGTNCVFEIVEGQKHIVSLWNGMSLHDAVAISQRHMFKWFPVLESQRDSTLIGCVSAAVLHRSCVEAARYNVDPRGSVVVFSSPDDGRKSGNEVAFPRPSVDVQVLDWTRYLDPCCVTSTPDMRIRQLLDVFTSFGIQYVIVKRGRKLAGIVTRKDLQRFIHEAEGSGKVFFGVRGAIQSLRMRRTAIRDE